MPHPSDVDLVMALPEDADGREAHDEVSAAKVNLEGAVNLSGGVEKDHGGDSARESASETLHGYLWRSI